jgi:hypothetical protein
MVVIAGLYHPHSALFTHNLADVMWPNNHCTYACWSRVSPVCPIAREVEGQARVTGNKLPHLPTAPSGRARSILPMVLTL